MNSQLTMSLQPAMSRDEILTVSRELFAHYGFSNPADIAMRRKIENLRDMAESYRASLDSGAVERLDRLAFIVPSELDGEQLWQYNGRYISLTDAKQALSPAPATVKESGVGGIDQRGTADVAQSGSAPIRGGHEFKSHHQSVPHPSAESINEAQEHGGQTFLGSDSQESPAGEHAPAASPLAGAEAMRAKILETCEAFAQYPDAPENDEPINDNFVIGFVAAASRLGDAIRTLPMPPEPEAVAWFQESSPGQFDQVSKEYSGQDGSETKCDVCGKPMRLGFHLHGSTFVGEDEQTIATLRAQVAAMAKERDFAKQCNEGLEAERSTWHHRAEAAERECAELQSAIRDILPMVSHMHQSPYRCPNCTKVDRAVALAGSKPNG